MQEDGGLAVEPPPPGLAPSIYGGDLLHFDLRGVAAPGDADRQRLLDGWPAAVSLIESAEALRAWGAAPEQRLALYFRHLPTQPGAEAKLISVVPHTGAWEARVALLAAELAREGPSSGAVGLRWGCRFFLERFGAHHPPCLARCLDALPPCSPLPARRPGGAERAHGA